jgi:hypothetical protein
MKQDALSVTIQNAATEEVIFSKSEVPEGNAWKLQQDWLADYFREEIQNAKEGSVRNYVIHSIIPVQIEALPTPPPPDNQEPNTPAGRDQNEERESSLGWFFWLVQYAVLLLVISGLSMLQYDGYLPGTMAGETEKGVIVLLAMLAIVLGAVGIYLGEREKLAVFTSMFDVFITGLAIFVTALSFVDFTDPTSAEAFQFLSICLNAWVVWLSFHANNSLLKMLLVLPAKVFCVVILLFLAIISAGAARSAIDAVDKQKYGEAAINAGISAASGAGCVYVKDFLKSLTKKSQKARRGKS